MKQRFDSELQLFNKPSADKDIISVIISYMEAYTYSYYYQFL